MDDYAGHSRNIVVIGGSAGGLAVIRHLAASLPADLPATVFVVLHGGTSTGLAKAIERRRMAVSVASDGTEFERGRMYVAPVGAHLLLHDGHMLVRRGPRENRARPAVDPLFRSAACSYGGRVIGIVLSGGLDDGTAGLSAIKQCGGITVVQDPDDAEAGGMPRNALRFVEIDHVSSAGDLPALVAGLVRQPAGASAPAPLSIRLEAAVAAQEPGAMDIVDQIGTRSRFSCPECGGVLWEVEQGPTRFRCHIGHAFGAETLADSQQAEIELALNKLLRSHREHVALLRRASERVSPGVAKILNERAGGYESDAAIIERLLGKQHLEAG
jgi:two-component system, chemotaxis family, protein-glutamate methylesterase/glutaminase